jgi:hypothetical protein
LSVVSEGVRAAVVARAGGRCEYCLVPMRGQVGRFPIDHVVPRTRGGPTELTNLALACPHCNGSKWAHVDGIDPATGQAVALFNPRTQRWVEHFRWSESDPSLAEGITACGRATINRLQLNHLDMVAIRRALIALGLFPEVER